MGYINEILNTNSCFAFGEYIYMRNGRANFSVGQYITNNFGESQFIGGKNVKAERNVSVLSFSEETSYYDSKYGDVVFGVSSEVINSENSLVYGRQNNIDGNKGVLSGGRFITGKNTKKIH